MAEGEEPCLAARGSTVVLASKERGAVVSSDGGRTFRAVHGTAGTVAAAAGDLDGRCVVVLSLASPLDGSSRIVVVEPGTGRAVTVAELAPAADAQDDEPVARRSGLGWGHPVDTRLPRASGADAPAGAELNGWTRWRRTSTTCTSAWRPGCSPATTPKPSCPTWWTAS